MPTGPNTSQVGWLLKCSLPCPSLDILNFDTLADPFGYNLLTVIGNEDRIPTL